MFHTFEQHYYEELEECSGDKKKRKLLEITDKVKQAKIDKHMKKHRNQPPYTMARESGYSAYTLDSEVDINPSLLKRQSTPYSSSSTTMISRLSDAPKLPVSCLAAVEHVIAMQNNVSDFIHDIEPSSKREVMYQILVKVSETDVHFRAYKSQIREALLREDPELHEKNIHIAYRPVKNISIEVSTQYGDILKIIKALKRLSNIEIINTNYSQIGLNDGVCLIKGDASNPIHALVNIANTKTKKGFLERDAGFTSGMTTESYQDNHWTFNFYQSLEELQKKTGYSTKSHAVKLYLKL